eukprot:TRINITY_DN7326_c0_g1_i2.p1 TRINITY_DN7326_c0_g1~~TRINITY_DN7326_c0_g1_i2.p1  ORF type:complete len:287 (-),score=71.23 TRINITY_DN7326_c0_g1_i2:36-770(-)
MSTAVVWHGLMSGNLGPGSFSMYPEVHKVLVVAVYGINALGLCLSLGIPELVTVHIAIPLLLLSGPYSVAAFTLALIITLCLLPSYAAGGLLLQVVFSSLGIQMFLSTGHRFLINGWQVDSANIFAGSVDAPVLLKGVVGVLNTFAGTILSIVLCVGLSSSRLVVKPVAAAPGQAVPTGTPNVSNAGRVRLVWIVWSNIVALLMLALFCERNRQHLMMWDLFAPRLVYASVWTVLQLLVAAVAC